MGQDAYVDDQLIKSIETIQEIFDIPTFSEASKKYDDLARRSTLGDILEEVEEAGGQNPDDPITQAEQRLNDMENDVEQRFPG